MGTLGLMPSDACRTPSDACRTPILPSDACCTPSDACRTPSDAHAQRCVAHAHNVADRAEEALGLGGGGEEGGDLGFGEEGAEAVGVVGAFVPELDEEPVALAGEGQRGLAGGFAAWPRLARAELAGFQLAHDPGEALAVAVEPEAERDDDLAAGGVLAEDAGDDGDQPGHDLAEPHGEGRGGGEKLGGEGGCGHARAYTANIPHLSRLFYLARISGTPAGRAAAGGWTDRDGVARDGMVATGRWMI